MTESASTRCTACGAAASGKFCSACGAPLGARHCTKCGAEVRAGARFCASCGAPLDGETRTSPVASGLPVAPLIVAGVALVALIGVLVFRREPRTAAADGAPPAVTQGGGLPDLSQMTPREAFDRLYNRVMTAAEQGDTSTVTQFSPMALQAYRNLDTVDADARYHAAMLRLHTGDVAGAQALADSILAAQPTHLFGFVLGAAIARFQQNPGREQELHARFLAAWDEEMKAGRPEYQDHQPMLDEFRREAASAR